MNDPLHFTREELTVTNRGTGVTLNKRLLDQQNAWGNLDTIKELHTERMELEFMMDETDDRSELKFLYAFWIENQFELQSAWGFDRNAKYHRPWYLNRCTCPKMDNDDWYPTGKMYINCECPIHGAL